LLRTVFARLKDAGLTLNREKCVFCKPSLVYLGYIVDSQGLRVDPAKVSAIVSIATPSNVQEVRRLVGTASWYRRFVPGFATILAPLTALLKKNVKFEWTPEAQASFDFLKEHLISAPLLRCPDFTRPFVIQCDASAYGIGSVLTQTFDDGEHVICYLSRSLSKQERNFTTTERECLSVIWSIEKLRHYLEGTRFTVITDHY